jgi:hypothetical protein
LVGCDILAHNDALPTTPWSAATFDWLVDRGGGLMV